ncbi:MAG: hypothetical protein PHO02_03855 [Candidatus Nanoarchaeia archaeon]|nr:hypothetical protein [Candidatus Nanoarchaeia archaeon]
MPKWNFINGLTKEAIRSVNPLWASAIKASLKSKATPLQSNYHVNTGAVTRNGKIVLGSNHEMAITDTITHGEEAVIAAALEKYGKDDPIQVIAFAGAEGEEIGSPCGNCRDAIRQYADLDNLVIINAPTAGGTAVVVPGNAYFKNDFAEANAEEKAWLLESDALAQALKAEKTAYDVYLAKSSPKIYGAAIACDNGLVFRGSYRGDVAYHPELPISAAIGNFRDGSDDACRKSVKMIVVASAGSMPDVMYKDRQHALEFAEAIQSLNNKSGIPLPVYLANGRQVFKTDTNEWLPFRFSPKHLGLEKAIAGGYEKLFS